jgi:hypothetical protein
MKNLRVSKKIVYLLLVFALLFSSITPIRILARDLTVQEERNSRLALGALNFSGSSKTTVKLHGYGLDTGDVSTVDGIVTITVGSRLREYPFEGTVPGLYNKDFGSWYLPGWTNAKLSCYRFTFIDGTKSNWVYPTSISIKNNF